MKTVEILEDHETPSHKFTGGTTVTLPDDLAQHLIDAAKARVKDAKEQQRKTTTKPKPENAAKPSSESRGN